MKNINKKTFTLAVVFLVLSLVWLGTNIYWRVTHFNWGSVIDFVIGFLFVLAGAGVVHK